MAEQQSASVLPDRPTEEVIAKPAPGAEVEETGEVQEDATLNEHDDETRGKKLSGAQRQKLKLERARQERDFWREEALKNRPAAAQEPEARTVQEDKPPAKPTRPKVEDFADFAAYDAAVVKYDADRDQYLEDKLAYELRQREVKGRQQAERQTVAEKFANQIGESRKQHADYDETVFTEDVPMSQAMHDAIVTSDHGAEVAYFLGKNPDEAERIAVLPPIAAIREIGKIESRIAGTKPAAEEEEQESPAAASRAPRPPSPVRRTSGASSEPHDSDDYKTWLRKREAQLKGK